MNTSKKLTTKGLISCVLMALVVLFTLFGNILVLGGETQDALEEFIEDYDDSKEMEFEFYDVDDMEEYMDELDYSKKEIKAGIKIDKFLYKIEDGKFNVFDVFSAISCLSAIKNAPDFVDLDNQEDILMLSILQIAAIAAVFFYLLIPIFGIMYLVFHFCGRKNKGIPVLIFLLLFLIPIGGLTALMTLADALHVSVPFIHWISVGLSIASIALWKVEKDQPVPSVQEESL